MDHTSYCLKEARKLNKGIISSIFFHTEQIDLMRNSHNALGSSFPFFISSGLIVAKRTNQGCFFFFQARMGAFKNCLRALFNECVVMSDTVLGNQDFRFPSNTVI